jgi:hypothetical protein
MGRFIHRPAVRFPPSTTDDEDAVDDGNANDDLVQWQT